MQTQTQLKEFFESELLSTLQEVEIIPTFSSNNYRTILQEMGEFVPQEPKSVPLYIALALYEEGKCNIVPPEYLGVEYLNRKIEDEKELKDDLTEINSFFFEHAKIFSNQAKNTIENTENFLSLINTIEKIRHEKILHIIKAMPVYPIVIRIQKITTCELIRVKTYLLKYLERYMELKSELGK